jgi:hypothetical protein
MTALGANRAAGWASLGTVIAGVSAALIASVSTWFALVLVAAVVCLLMAGIELGKERRA